jgi:hypothetical protein
MSNEIKDRIHAQLSFLGVLVDGPANIRAQSGFASVERTAAGIYEATLVEAMPANRESLSLQGPAIEGEGLAMGFAVVVKQGGSQSIYEIQCYDDSGALFDPEAFPVYFNVYVAAHDQG